MIGSGYHLRAQVRDGNVFAAGQRFGCFAENGGLRGECYDPVTGEIYLDFSRFGGFRSDILDSFD